MHPLSRLLDDLLPEMDVGVVSHGFAPHGRDYVLLIQNSFPVRPGTYRVTFTHAVEVAVSTALDDNAWQHSWSDDFIDYERWKAVGTPDGYVFGVNWSLAYPGFEAIKDDPSALSWSEKLKRDMYAATVETDLFKLKLIFHDAHIDRVSDDASIVAQVITPLP